MGKLKKINIKMTSNTTPSPFEVKMISNHDDSGAYGENVYKCFDGDVNTSIKGPNYGYNGYNGIYDLYITLNKSYVVKNIKIIGHYFYNKYADGFYNRRAIFISLDNGSNFFTYDSTEAEDTGQVYKFNNQISSSNLIIRFQHVGQSGGSPDINEIELYAEIPDTLLKNLNNRFISINNKNYQDGSYKILDSVDLNNLSDDLFNLDQLCKETEINNKKIIPLQEILKENKNGIKILKIV